MGMSSHVYGMVEPDGYFLRMKKVYDVCKEANVSLPDEVHDYFEGHDPDKVGITEELPKEAVDKESGREMRFFPPRKFGGKNRTQ